MKKSPIVATSGKKGTPDFKELKGEAQQAESWADCQKIAGGEKEAIAIFNRQIVTDALNKLRKPVADPVAAMVKKAPPEAKDAILAILKKHGIAIG